MVGDFNVPDIIWKILSGVGTHGRNFCGCVLEKNLTLVLLEPTHKLGNTFDLLLSNCLGRISSLWIDLTSPSHHYSITLKLQLRNSITCCHSEHKQVPCYGKADLVGLDRFLLDLDFSPVQHLDNTDNIYNYLTNIINEASSRFVLTVTLPGSPSPEWFNADVMDTIDICYTRHLV